VTRTLFDGQRLRVVRGEIVGDALRRDGIVERGLTRFLLRRLGPGSVFVDVGAHYGYFSVVVARRVWPSGSVVAFEPARGTVALLRRNTAHLDAVSVEQAAVGDHPGRASLRDHGPRRSSVNTVLAGARVPPAERRALRADVYDVPSVTLDGYAAAHGLRPDAVKLDAEGAELAVLRGMEGLLRDVRPVVALETGDYEGMASPPTSSCIDHLEARGYRAFDVDDDGGLHPHRRRTTYGYGTLVFTAGGGGEGEPDPAC
jgi:FkbM family methyltransferase